MATPNDLIDQIKVQWLEPPTEMPLFSVITDNPLTSGATSVTYAGTMVSPDEDKRIRPGIVAEVGDELVLVTAKTNQVLTVVRRQTGGNPTAQEHAKDTRIYLPPRIARWRVFEALIDSINSLREHVWTQKTVDITSGDGIVELNDVRAVGVRGFRYVDSDGRPCTGPVRFWRDWRPFASKRGVEFHPDIPTGKAGHLVYDVRPGQPALPTDDLIADLDWSTRWYNVVRVGAVAQLMAGLDLTRQTVEFITQALAVQGFPPGAGRTVHRTLLEYYAFLFNQVRDEQKNVAAPVTGRDGWVQE